MELNRLKINSAKLEEGQWVDNIPGLEDLRVRVRGLGSVAYREALNRRRAAIPRSERNADGSLPIKVSDKVTGQALSDAILLDWANLSIDGEAKPYNKELAETILCDPDFSSFSDGVIWAATQVTSEAMVIEEAILKN